MKWIKKAGFTLLFTLSLGVSVPSNAMDLFSTPKKLEALTNALKSLNLSEETIKEIVSLIDRLEKSGLAVIAQLTTGLDEAIQGSKELIALNTIQGQITSLVKKIQEFKKTSKSVTTPVSQEKEHKRSAAAAEKESKEAVHAATLSLNTEPTQVDTDKKFITDTVEPVIREIDETLKNLKSNLTKRITEEQRLVLTNLVSKIKNIIGIKKVEAKEASATLAQAEEMIKNTTSDRTVLQGMIDTLIKINKELTKEEAPTAVKQPIEIPQETLALFSLINKEKALDKIIEKLPKATLITDTFVQELSTLHKEITNNIKSFKGGLAGVLDGTIKDLTEGLNSAGKTISSNIAEDLQLNLRSVLGSPKMIRIIEDIHTWLTQNNLNPGNDPDHEIIKKYFDKEQRTIITTSLEELINELNYLFNNMTNNPDKADRRLGELIEDFKKAINDYKKVIKNDVETNTNTVQAPRTFYAAICRTHTELVNHIQATLSNIISVLKKTLFDTVDRCTKDLKKDIKENLKEFNKDLRTTINTDLPHTLKKGVGYLALGTIAACAMCHIILHDRPWQGHLKNIGIATGATIGMFLVDPFINWWYRARAS